MSAPTSDLRTKSIIGNELTKRHVVIFHYRFRGRPEETIFSCISLFHEQGVSIQFRDMRSKNEKQDTSFFIIQKKMSSVQSDLMRDAIDKVLAKKHIAICHYWYGGFFLDDLCRIITLFSAPLEEKWDESIQGGSIQIDSKTRIITTKTHRPWNTVWATRKIRIGSSSKYPCIHEWIFDKIKIQNGILGIYFADGDLPQKGDGHFCGHRYWINTGTIFKPMKEKPMQAQTHF